MSTDRVLMSAAAKISGVAVAGMGGGASAGGGKCGRRVEAERGRGLQQLVTFFQLELHEGRVPEEQIRVHVRAVDVEEVLKGVTHVLKGL